MSVLSVSSTPSPIESAIELPSSKPSRRLTDPSLFRSPASTTSSLSPSDASTEYGELALFTDFSEEDTPSYEEVRDEVTRLEKSPENLSRFVAKYDSGSPEQSIEEALKAKHPRGELNFASTGAGTTETSFAKVNGQSRYIAKRVSLPMGVFGSRWGDVREQLEYTEGEGVVGKVEGLFMQHPNRILTHDYPHLNFAQREKLAYVIGKNLGVPKTEVVLTKDGAYSLHDFVKNEGDVIRYPRFKSREVQNRIDLDSLQNIVVLDILTENQDRNGGNILVASPKRHWWSCLSPSTPSIKLIPIDHALTFQKRTFGFDSVVACWKGWEKAALPLTDRTKRMIRGLDGNRMLAEARLAGLEIDPKVGGALPRNIQFLKDEIRRNPRISSRELHNRFLLAASSR